MRQKLIIPGRLSGYNQLSSGHWRRGYEGKRADMWRVWCEIIRQGICQTTGKATITIRCYEPNARRDDDNVTSGAAKIILDALQRRKVIKGDGQKYVRCVKCPIEVDRKNPRVEVIIEELEKEGG